MEMIKKISEIDLEVFELNDSVFYGNNWRFEKRSTGR